MKDLGYGYGCEGFERHFVLNHLVKLAIQVQSHSEKHKQRLGSASYAFSMAPAAVAAQMRALYWLRFGLRYVSIVGNWLVLRIF